jgi:putative transposase
VTRFLTPQELLQIAQTLPGDPACLDLGVLDAVCARVQGVAEAEARKKVRVPVPTKPVIQKHLNQIKGDSRTAGLPEGVYGPERPCPWWHEVSTHAFQSAFMDADRAWTNWLASVRGARAGRRVGHPRFKKKARSREAFRLHHDVKRPAPRLRRQGDCAS